MKPKILKLIDEQTSPLFRIMTVYNDEDLNHRSFDNNLSAFHIGNGYILSVAHNLRLESKLLSSVPETEFQTNIISKCDQNDEKSLLAHYIYVKNIDRRILSIKTNDEAQLLTNIFQKINYDTRYVTSYSKGFCKPFLIIQFKTQKFYGDQELTKLFNPLNIFYEQVLNCHTFLLELSLVKTFYPQDIALYKIVNVNSAVIAKIPYTEVDYDLCNTGELLYCLQSSPSGTNLGRLLNEFQIEGLMEHHSVITDKYAGNYFFEGLRYLLKGYFRFGSSGAPYFSYNKEKDHLTVNALQSEASPIQLTINNSMEGNCQYVNAIATPLYSLKNELEKIIQ